MSPYIPKGELEFPDVAPVGLTAYTDRLQAEPGERVRCLVSCEAPAYRAELVRLTRGDGRPPGPPMKETVVAGALDAELPGRVQPILTGSYATAEPGAALDDLPGLTAVVWVWLTLPGRPQGLLRRWADGRPGSWSVELDADGTPVLAVVDADGDVQRLAGEVPLPAFTWAAIAAAIDPAAGRLVLAQHAHARFQEPATHVVERDAAALSLAGTGAPLHFAALRPGGGYEHGGHFNGRLERPALFASALPADVLRALVEGGQEPEELRPAALWDFAREIPSQRIRDIAGGLDGELVNRPARAVTGRLWDREVRDWREAPEQYAAIHFHDDDLEDCGWEVDFEVDLPAELESGVYALRLTAGADVDRVPVIVTPRGGRATAPIAVLLSTMTYLAYANDPPFYEHVTFTPHDAYALAHRLRSTYSPHDDGSGCYHATQRRPLLNLRPDFLMWAEGLPHNLGGDLDVVDWLTESGFAFDVITDHDLHHGGREVLGRYRTVITGHHPEYWSGAMLDGLEAYLETGGRVMYLGGNGLSTAVSLDPQRPWVIEIRRPVYSTWPAGPGEHHHATTGEPGGEWEHRGRAEQAFVGVGVGAVTAPPMHDARGHPYLRTEAAADPRAAFVFEGVEGDGPIGAFGAQRFGGAAGGEVDNANGRLGTPPHALVLAVADTPGYEILERHGASARAEMVLFETPHGGAVFSVGSMDWSGALCHAGYDNDVARITRNVLVRFADPEWAPVVPSAARAVAR
jgi:N,N-dimethylformamidase